MCRTNSLPSATARVMLTAAATGLSLPVAAQSGFHGHAGHHGGPVAGIADVWQEFIGSCEALLTDPQAFVAGHPATAPDGQQLVNRSDDNQVVVLTYATPAGVWRQMELIGIPGELHVLCQAASEPDLESFADQATYAARSDRSEVELRSLVAADAGGVLVGGRMPIAEPLPELPGGFAPPIAIYTYIFGIRTEFAGERRFVYANVNGDAIRLTGHYIISAGAEPVARDPGQPPPPPPAPEAPAPAASSPAADATMSVVAELCLRNYRTPENSVPELQALGLDLIPGMDAGSWEFSGDGVFGILSVAPQLYCSIQSTDVVLDQARALGSEVAQRLFGELVQVGAPEGGMGPCDGLSIFAPRQLIRVRYAQAGNSGECIDDGTSAIIIH